MPFTRKREAKAGTEHRMGNPTDSHPNPAVPCLPQYRVPSPAGRERARVRAGVERGQNHATISQSRTAHTTSNVPPRQSPPNNLTNPHNVR